MFHVGQQVVTRWGIARIKTIEVTNESDRKYGYDVQSVPSNCTFVVDLDNGHWAYGDCISEIGDDDV
jgi:hypothetical protein